MLLAELQVLAEHLILVLLPTKQSWAHTLQAEEPQQVSQDRAGGEKALVQLRTRCTQAPSCRQDHMLSTGTMSLEVSGVLKQIVLCFHKDTMGGTKALYSHARELLSQGRGCARPGAAL